MHRLIDLLDWQVDHNGRAFSDGELRGRFFIVYFGFTFCPDICPAELTRIANAVNLVGAS